jgi:heavy metal sensor kinase
LRVRLALLTALLLCLIQLVLSTAFYTFTSNWLLNQVDQSLMTTAAQGAAALRDGDPMEEAVLDLQIGVDTFLRERRFFIRVIDRGTGKILNESAFYDLKVTEQARGSSASFETLDLPDSLMRVYTLPLEDRQHRAIQIGQSLDEVNQTQLQIVRLLMLMLIATAVLAILAGWFIANRALIPVSAITHTAREIGEKDLSRRIAMPLPDDELGRLAQTFNGMLDRIEDAFQRQRQFTADAAHELRTPLSIMQTGLDVVLSQPRAAKDYRATLENMLEEVLRLSQLTTQLLMLARADTHTLTIQPRPVDLSLLLNTVSDQIALTAEQKQITLTCDVPPRIAVKADEDRLIQLALNLLENAVKYTPPGGAITVTLARSDGKICFSIADTGIGVAPQHLPHIFDRFYRVDRARSRGGVGLGLAIAKQIAQLHGGDITVVSQPGLGSTFSVTLPAS